MKNRKVIGNKTSIRKAHVKKFFVNRAKKYNPLYPEVAMLYRDKDPKSAKKMAEEEKKIMLPLVNPEKTDAVLDIGCGIGRWAEILAENVALYHGTDMVDELIAIAQKRVGHVPNVTFQSIAAEEIIPEALTSKGEKKFNKVIIAGVLHYVNDSALKTILKNIPLYTDSDAHIIIRGPVAIRERLTLDGIWSEELEHEYSSIYRTRNDLLDFFTTHLSEFEVIEDRPLFPDKLNNYADKRQHVFVLKRKKQLKTAYCFDLDGTITKDEILPVLSEEIGLYEEIEALTAATIKGIIPFEKSFLLRTRLLAEIPISQVQKIVGNIRLHKNIVDFIHTHRENSFVITGNLDVWMEPIKKKLGCKFYSSAAKRKGDKLLGVSHVLEKSEAIKEIMDQFDRIVVIGDGMGDVRMFEVAHTRIAFGGVHPPIDTLLELSDYVVYNEHTLCRLLNTL